MEQEVPATALNNNNEEKATVSSSMFSSRVLKDYVIASRWQISFHFKDYVIAGRL